ncbi:MULTISPECIES: arylsulfatase [Halopseudomonas]|uniref:Arylsulfatase n=1 Tax=Halopseudomonas bauzanensis TaxID=653930 RepID=A0A1H9PLW5_9GAMM|nr:MULTISPECIES: arylsulfatase [Halopseudomonas]WGK60967.1 arylsulfatase [Halopseudomonas sp. SMJS2]SER49080.1 arylsulfatase [Halopseudomonas bauzanensis]SFL72510.1 arylsulfatase [Halopseudomonas bauzanensis]
MLRLPPLALLLGTLALLAPLYGQADTRPNILLIVADDMGFSDPGVYGGEISTPNIDTLAAEGIQFSNFNVAATCSPTRAMLMTGVTSHKVGMGNMKEIMADNQKGQPGYETWLNDQAVTLPTLLRDAGYRTYMAGKWHLGSRPESLPNARGFDRSVALLESGADNWEAKHYLPAGTATWVEDGQPISLPDDFYSSFYYADKLIEYLSSEQGSEKPFFAYLAFQAVHAPHHAPEAYVEKYADTYQGGWDVLRQQRYERLTAMGLLPRTAESVISNDWGTFYDTQPIDWDGLSDEERAYRARQMAVYAGMAEAMDESIGRVISHLKASGDYDNTLIVFMSDNGAESTVLTEIAPLFYRLRYDQDYADLGRPGSWSEYGPGWGYAANTPFYSYKGSPFNGGLRVPMIVRYPGVIEPGSRTSAFGYVTDIAPTLLELSNTAVPDGEYQGREVHRIMGTSMAPLLRGESDRIHADDEVVVYELAGGIAIWQGDYKLVVSNSSAIASRAGMLLFNMQDDPLERNDLSAQQPERVAALMEAYHSFVAEHGLVEVPEDYNAWEQLNRNAREQLLDRHGHQLLLGAVILVLLLGWWLRTRLRRRRR